MFEPSVSFGYKVYINPDIVKHLRPIIFAKMQAPVMAALEEDVGNLEWNFYGDALKLREAARPWYRCIRLNPYDACEKCLKLPLGLGLSIDNAR